MESSPKRYFAIAILWSYFYHNCPIYFFFRRVILLSKIFHECLVVNTNQKSIGIQLKSIMHYYTKSIFVYFGYLQKFSQKKKEESSRSPKKWQRISGGAGDAIHSWNFSKKKLSIQAAASLTSSLRALYEITVEVNHASRHCLSCALLLHAAPSRPIIR